MTEPTEPNRQDDLVDVFVDDLPSSALRVLLRDHLLWLFVGGGIAAVGYVLPDSGMWLNLLRTFLIGGGLLFGAVRLFQINGIVTELRDRTTPETSEPPSDPSRGPDQET